LGRDPPKHGEKRDGTCTEQAERLSAINESLSFGCKSRDESLKVRALPVEYLGDIGVRVLG